MKLKKRIWVPLLVVAILFVACAIYLNDYYRATTKEINEYVNELDVDKNKLADGTIVYGKDDAKVGFIYYPGGKVEYNSYEPLMAKLASEGMLCVLVEMPFNLAVFDMNAADGIQEKYPKVEEWYIGGHSLGGSMAASYLSDNSKEFEGLILLGSYSIEDLSDKSLEVLSIYGSEDKVLNREKYDENKPNLPEDFEEFVIEGGCHAYFGMYGEQDGDGDATISVEKQIEITAEAILEFAN